MLFSIREILLNKTLNPNQISSLKYSVETETSDMLTVQSVQFVLSSL